MNSIYTVGKNIKVYLTCNTLPRNNEIPQFGEFILNTQECGIDAVIVADLGIMTLVKKFTPNMEIHMSTQTGIVNYAAANQLYDMGAKRVVLARELSLEEIAEIRAKCRKLKLEKGIGLVIIDYLQLVEASGRRNSSREQEISEISRSLKILAKELDVPVIALSQLSRSAEKRDDKRPMLSDLRESGAIEQDADIVMFLYRDDYYNENSEKKNIAEIILAKHRGGSTGTVELSWLGSFTKFANLEKYRTE